ncbi:MAG: hypothetical protein V8T45_10225 [Oscillospiraceae bacterium]
MKRIFFVEDDLSLINGLSFALKKQGYEIDIARTSLEADRLWMNGSMTWSSWTCLCRTAPAMTCAGKSAKAPRCRSSF